MMKYLLQLSNEYGRNPDFVLAGGGNTSLKEEGTLFVKGSGTTLATICEDGFVRMSLRKLEQIMEKHYSDDLKTREAEVLADLMSAREAGETKRPSVETSLHGMIPFRYVVHLHPAPVNGVTCSKCGKQFAEKQFPDAIWVDISEPGYTLAVKVRDALADFKKKRKTDCRVIFLKNHGIFVAGNTPEEIRAGYDSVIGTIRKATVREPDFTPADNPEAARFAPALRMLLGEDGNCVRFECGGEYSAFTESEAAFADLAGAYTPDHIVYNRAYPLFVRAARSGEDGLEILKSSIAGYRELYKISPRIVAVERLGIFVAGKNAKAADISAEVFKDELKIAVYAKSFGGTDFMPDHYVDFIVNWEVESYRASKAVSAGSGKADGKTVVVTGSAQGFGQGIAEDLFAEGANVVLADLNYELAKSVADRCNASAKPNRAVAVKCDVTDEASVKNLLYQTVKRFGGLDVYVNNAGIVRAGGIDELTVPMFDLVTKVNYTAYFIGVKHASEVMKLQHRFAPGRFFDVVQINSKSGLSGSNKNFAYAGSKFGGIGLTESFALELIPYNIKVNSICPGNFLEGPLWTDPEKGLFVQYFKAGKVPGAKSVADVKKYYESKVPAGRGCLTKDVMRAIYYAIEQEYETGQAIPVTGGQSMLK